MFVCERALPGVLACKCEALSSDASAAVSQTHLFLYKAGRIQSSEDEATFVSRMQEVATFGKKRIQVVGCPLGACDRNRQTIGKQQAQDQECLTARHNTRATPSWTTEIGEDGVLCQQKPFAAASHACKLFPPTFLSALGPAWVAEAVA